MTDKNTEYADRLLNECIEECKSAGVPLCRILPSVKISRSTTKFGSYDTKTGQVFVSEIIFKLSEYVIKNVMIHELIHSVPGAANHGKTFKRWADIMNSRGWIIEPHSDLRRLAELSGKRMEDLALPETVFIACRICGDYVLKKENSATLRFTGRHRCGKCDGGLDVISVDEKGNKRNLSEEWVEQVMKVIMGSR